MLNESNSLPPALPPVPAAPANLVPRAVQRPVALPAEAAQAVDTVEISPKAKEAAKLVSALSRLPELDPNDVQRAQQRVNNAAPAPVAAALLAEKLLTES